MKLAIHTGWWAPERHADLPALLAEVADAGYFGFVLDAGRVDLARPDLLYRWATHHALNVVALDMRGPLPGLDLVDQVAAFAAEVLAPFVAVGGPPGADPPGAQALNAISARCRAHGVRLCCRPPGADGLHDLVAQTEPDLVSFALDLDWLARAGPAAIVLDEWLPRTGYLVVTHPLASETSPAMTALLEALRGRDLWLVLDGSQA